MQLGEKTEGKKSTGGAPLPKGTYIFDTESLETNTTDSGAVQALWVGKVVEVVEVDDDVNADNQIDRKLYWGFNIVKTDGMDNEFGVQDFTNIVSALGIHDELSAMGDLNVGDQDFSDELNAMAMGKPAKVRTYIKNEEDYKHKKETGETILVPRAKVADFLPVE